MNENISLEAKSLCEAAQYNVLYTIKVDDLQKRKYGITESKVEELEEKLNDSIEKNKELHEQIGGLTKDSIINEVSEDLTDLEIDLCTNLSRGAIMNLKQARQKTSTACFFIKLGKHCGLAAAAALLPL